MAEEIKTVMPPLQISVTEDAVYARINMSDTTKTKAVGYAITPERDISAARALCARDLGNQVEHFVRTGEWL